MELLDIIKTNQLESNLKTLKFAVHCLELAFFPRNDKSTQRYIDNAEEAINNLYNI